MSFTATATVTAAIHRPGRDVESVVSGPTLPASGDPLHGVAPIPGAPGSTIVIRTPGVVMRQWNIRLEGDRPDRDFIVRLIDTFTGQVIAGHYWDSKRHVWPHTHGMDITTLPRNHVMRGGWANGGNLIDSPDGYRRFALSVNGATVIVGNITQAMTGYQLAASIDLDNPIVDGKEPPLPEILLGHVQPDSVARPFPEQFLGNINVNPIPGQDRDFIQDPIASEFIITRIDCAATPGNYNVSVIYSGSVPSNDDMRARFDSIISLRRFVLNTRLNKSVVISLINFQTNLGFVSRAPFFTMCLWVLDNESDSTPRAAQHLGYVDPYPISELELGSIALPQAPPMLRAPLFLGSIDPGGSLLGSVAIPSSPDVPITPVEPPPPLVGAIPLGVVTLRRNPPRPVIAGISDVFLGSLELYEQDIIPPASVYLGGIDGYAQAISIPVDTYLGSVDAYPLAFPAGTHFLGSVDTTQLPHFTEFLGSVIAAPGYLESWRWDYEPYVPPPLVSWRWDYEPLIVRDNAPGWHINIAPPSAVSNDFDIYNVVSAQLYVTAALNNPNPPVYNARITVEQADSIREYGRREIELLQLTRFDPFYQPTNPYVPNTSEIEQRLRRELAELLIQPRVFRIDIESETPAYLTAMLGIRIGTPITLVLANEYRETLSLIANSLEYSLQPHGQLSLIIYASSRI